MALGRLLGLHHLAEQFLHVARQDDVLDADALDPDADLGEARADPVGDGAVDGGLVLQQRVERAGADRGAKPELDLLVEVVQRVLGRAEGLLRVLEPVGGRQVDPEAHLVAGEDLLALNLQRLHAQVHDFDLDAWTVGPEGVRPRRERTRQRPVHVEQAHMPVRNVPRVDAARVASQSAEGLGVPGDAGFIEQALGEPGVDGQTLVEVEPVHVQLHRAVPVELALVRTDDLGNAFVPVHHGDFARSGGDDREQAFHVFAPGVDQVVGERVREGGRRQVEGLHGVLAAEGVEAIGPRFEEADEVPVLEQEPAFVLAHDGLAIEQHGVLLFQITMRPFPQRSTGRRGRGSDATRASVARAAALDRGRDDVGGRSAGGLGSRLDAKAEPAPPTGFALLRLAADALASRTDRWERTLPCDDLALVTNDASLERHTVSSRGACFPDKRSWNTGIEPAPPVPIPQRLSGAAGLVLYLAELIPSRLGGYYARYTPCDG